MPCYLNQVLPVMQGVYRLLSDVRSYVGSPDVYNNETGQKAGHPQSFQDLESHAEALEKQDVILAINRSHEYFDHKGAPGSFASMRACCPCRDSLRQRSLLQSNPFCLAL